MYQDVSELRQAERTSAATGNDLTLEGLGDLVVNEFGDLVINTGSSSIQSSLLRRLQTPSNGYSRWVKTTTGLKLINESYGNELYSYLSSSLNSSNLERIKESIKRAAQQDNRISVQRVSLESVDRTSLNAVILYTIKGEQELQTINTNLNLGVTENV